MNFEQLKALKPKIQALALEYKIDPETIRVFGSVARGESTEASDVDFLVHPHADCNIFDLAAFHEDVGKLLQCSVDVVSDRAIFPPMQMSITSDAKPL